MEDNLQDNGIILGVPVALWNTAMDTMILSIKSGKKIYQAVSEGYELVKNYVSEEDFKDYLVEAGMDKNWIDAPTEEKEAKKTIRNESIIEHIQNEPTMLKSMEEKRRDVLSYLRRKAVIRLIEQYKKKKANGNNYFSKIQNLLKGILKRHQKFTAKMEQFTWSGVLKVVIIFILVLIGALIFNGNRQTLSKSVAEKLIIKNLEIPIVLTRWLSSDDIPSLYEKGLINSYTINGSTGKPDLELDETNKLFFLGKNEHGAFKFKLCNIDLNKIEGVYNNEDEGIAKVRFSLKVVELTKFGEGHQYHFEIFNNKNYFDNYYTELKSGEIINGEIIFRKFDSGWLMDNDVSPNAEKIFDRILFQDKIDYFQDNFNR